jgi:hypothetical protein
VAHRAGAPPELLDPTGDGWVEALVVGDPAPDGVVGVLPRLTDALVEALGPPEVLLVSEELQPASATAPSTTPRSRRVVFISRVFTRKAGAPPRRAPRVGYQSG